MTRLLAYGQAVRFLAVGMRGSGRPVQARACRMCNSSATLLRVRPAADGGMAGAGLGRWGHLAHAPGLFAVGAPSVDEREQARSGAPMRARRVRERTALRAAHPVRATGATAMKARPASVASGSSARVLSWQWPTTCLSAGVVGPNFGHAEQAQRQAGQLSTATERRIFAVAARAATARHL